MQIEDYVKAGKIAGEVRENVRQKDWIGSTLAEICEYVESEIIKRGAKCAFPVNTSLNEVAAHYTAEPNDPKIVSDSTYSQISAKVLPIQFFFLTFSPTSPAIFPALR